MKTISVKVQPDHLERLAKGRKPILALAELVWNSLDADATDVRVSFDRDFSGGIEAIRIQDNGTGITPVDVEGGFARLGGSWKRVNTYTRHQHRLVHGKEGKGRFQAFALGAEVEWISCYESMAELREITIVGSVDRLGTFMVSDPSSVGCKQTGTDVVITGLEEAVNALAREGAPAELAEIFAFYLRQYPTVEIWYDGRRIDPSALEANAATYRLLPVEVDGRIIDDAMLVVIEWKAPTSRSLYLCDPEGFALHTLNVGIKAPGFEFTAYLRSRYFRVLYEENLLLIGDLTPGVAALHEAAKSQLKDHFRQRAAEQASALVSEWKREKVYPFDGEPTTIIESTKRQVFDVIAYNVHSYLPDFPTTDRKSKQFSLQLLRQALETNPESMQRILSDVLDLPKQKQDELAELLNRTSLSAIISASKVVADRLDFLRGLDILVYEPESKKQLLERRQLHRIVADHVWIFGEEFNLSADDESLTEVLRKHIKLLGRADLVTEPVRRLDGSEGIVDLMLSRWIPQSRSDEREHLVVELKRPTQKINQDVLGQITNYALAVAKDERFRDTHTRWSFWAVSNDMDEYARFQTRQKDRPRGMHLENEEHRIVIWAKTWAEILEDCRSRLTFFQKQLDYTVDRESALGYLRVTHEKYFPPILRQAQQTSTV